MEISKADFVKFIANSFPTMRAIPSFPGYSAEPSGNVFSFWKPTGNGNRNGVKWIIDNEPRALAINKSKYGYAGLKFRKDGKSFSRRRSRLILETFVGECPEDMECCHNDGDKENDCVSNLRWDTPKNNNADKKRHGTDIHVSGVNHPAAKLNECQVENVRWFCALYGHGSQMFFAKLWNVSPCTINAIIKKRNWV